VVGARLVLAGGDSVDCSTEVEPELFEVARLSLGAAGLVTRLQLQLRDAYRLVEQGWSEPIEALLPRFAELIGGHRHFEFFWYPHDDSAVAKTIDETDADAVYPLAEEGSRCAWSFEVLPNHRPHKHTEMEYSVPAARGPECFQAIRALIQRDFAGLRWPVEYRTVAADDVWLSMAHGRATATISVHQDVREDEEPYFRACEEIFLAHEGRPHWGKVNYLDGDQLANAYPRWQAWWAARDRVDPRGVFLNDYLRAIRPV
jgi:FAD/FMN-containing dehydrogenase